MSLELKIENGKILGKVDGSLSTKLLSRTKTVVEGFPIEILHFFDTEANSTWFLLSGITMKLLSSRRDSETILDTRGDVRSRSKRIWYDKPVIVFCRNIFEGKNIYLLDQEGRILSGSNTFERGYLCLGSDFNPLDLDPLHYLFHWNANQDLSWVGGSLTGETKGANKVFHVSQWPHASIAQFRLPQLVKDALSRWSSSSQPEN